MEVFQLFSPALSLSLTSTSHTIPVLFLGSLKSSTLGLWLTSCHLTSSTRAIAMSIHAIPFAVLEEVIHQHVQSSSLVEKSHHLSQDELAGLLASPTIWPRSPVFSPESNSHQGYPLSQATSAELSVLICSNIKVVTINGKRYPSHQVIYPAFHRDLTPGLVISHTVCLGKRFEQ
jgi:hypothetical protein